jgi:hypothetical protein
MMPDVPFTCHAIFPSFLPRGFGNHTRIRGAEADERLPAEWTPRHHQTSPPHAAADLVLRAVKLDLYVFWKQAANYEKIHVKGTKALILVHYVYLGLSDRLSN